MRLLSGVVILVFLFQSTKPFPALTAFEITVEILEMANSLFEIFDTVNDKADLIQFVTKSKETALLEKLDSMNLRIKQLDDRINGVDQRLNTIIEMLNHLPQVIRHELNLQDIRNKQNFLNIYFATMESYVRNFDELENSTIVNFCENVVSSDPNSVRFLMKAIYNLVITDDFLKAFLKQFEPRGIFFCIGAQSPQEALHKFLSEILLINFKSFYLEQVAYSIKKQQLKQGTFTREIKLAKKEFIRRQNSIIKKINEHMSRASRELWKCDPPKHVENQTYLRIGNFLHACIFNKAHLDPLGKCQNECDAYKMTKPQENCRENKWCNKQLPASRIINCQYLDSSMTVCSNKNTRKNNRRYQYVELGNGKVLGKKQSCRGYKTDLSTYIYWIVWRCSYCFCLCDEQSRGTDVYINLRLSLANMNDNRVVTGLRFVKHNEIFHLQIQEGKLLKRGKIDPDSVRWVPVDNYKHFDTIEGKDFHKITWEKRSFELSTIMAQNGSVVTGVRFRLIRNSLDLEVLTTPFNFTTGKLLPSLSTFKGTRNLNLRHKFKQQVKLSKPDVPTGSTEPHTLITTGQYIEFRNTDLYKDLAQTTVPFFDSQPVNSKNPVPLSGVSLIHKGREGSGGFIAPKIFTYDFSQHLEEISLETVKRKQRLRN
ncbi:hypothetical protein TcasGA2_TC006207 [Tribolium castaneum]|uniref:Uncharacterized protein n=3 Tax=Tribolium castaneum TaxID=7070 RepID=D6WVE2_TRICA|nr:hypothetical protein TcasGA2_TC006207 [Tribolium castaneum]